MRYLLMGLVLVVASCGGVSGAPAARTGASSARQAAFQPLGASMVKQLETLTNANWARVSGRDTRLPPHVNGHDEFAAQWTRQILANLHGLPVGVYRQAFPTSGFRGLPAERAGRNIVVTVPGSRHPDRAIIVGAHYDGEPDSKGSAYDDASGCVIMLGLSHVLGAIWRAHGLPSLTVEFVLFDAEEQGLVGSSYFGWLARQGAAMPRPVVMINEEQSGVGYPMRPFGLHSQAPVASYAITSTKDPFMQRTYGSVTWPAKSALVALQSRLRTARAAVFPQLHTAYRSLPYRGRRAAAFTAGDRGHLAIGPISQCCSDNDPFDALGIPTVTFSGDWNYYYRTAKPWSFPFDQPQDTFQLLACDVGGSPRPNAVLAAALDLPMALSAATVADYAPPATGSGIAVFSTLPQAGKQVRFAAFGATHVQWSFGDGSNATGAAKSHTFGHPGTYRIQARSGRAMTTWSVRVRSVEPDFVAPLSGDVPPVIRWHPAALQKIPGCH